MPQVPNLIKSKTEGAKNKGRKAQGCIGYLTQERIIRRSKLRGCDTVKCLKR